MAFKDFEKFNNSFKEFQRILTELNEFLLMIFIFLSRLTSRLCPCRNYKAYLGIQVCIENGNIYVTGIS